MGSWNGGIRAVRPLHPLHPTTVTCFQYIPTWMWECHLMALNHLRSPYHLVAGTEPEGGWGWEVLPSLTSIQGSGRTCLPTNHLKRSFISQFKDSKQSCFPAGMSGCIPTLPHDSMSKWHPGKAGGGGGGGAMSGHGILR